MPNAAAMPLAEAMDVLHRARREEIVVTSMGAAREWQRLSNHPLDFHHIPSCMGHTTALGLGIALAQPKREVITLTGDGSLLMSLGSLVTIAASGATNITIILCNNGVYEVTGGQSVPGGGTVDFLQIAAAAGFTTTAAFENKETWENGVESVLKSGGPRFVELSIQPVIGDYGMAVPVQSPISAQIASFRQALNAGNS